MIIALAFLLLLIAGLLTVRQFMLTIQQLRRDSREVLDRLAALERKHEAAQVPVAAAAPPQPPPAPAPQPAPVAKAPVQEEVTPEILMVLSAAVAAFFGKRARIRSARLVPTEHGSAWAQQGRVFVQASHNLPHMPR